MPSLDKIGTDIVNRSPKGRIYNVKFVFWTYIRVKNSDLIPLLDRKGTLRRENPVNYSRFYIQELKIESKLRIEYYESF